MPVDAAARPVIERLALSPNPLGGWFRQVHECRPAQGTGRSLMTVINFLLDRARPVTTLHRSGADAVHYFHQGSPLTVVTLSPGGALGRQVLGPDLDRGQSLQVVVPGGTWKALELGAGPWALISEAVSPGWEMTDQEEATPSLFERDHPDLRPVIEHLIRGAGRPQARDTRPPSPGGAVGSEWRDRLALEPNPEGGWFRQTYESSAEVETDGGARPLVNSIYYLLTAASPVGHLHRNRSAITHFHHDGGPATYLLIAPDGGLHEVVLGPDPAAGHVVSFTAPGGWWKASHVLAPGATDCLISEVVSPGFRYDDHEMATIGEIQAELAASVGRPRAAEALERVRPYVLDPG